MNQTEVDSVVEAVAMIHSENKTTTGNTTFSDSALITYNELTNKQIILSIVLGLITIVTIVSNGVVIFIFATSRRKLGSPTHLLLFNMTVSDLLVGIVVMPTLASVTILEFKWIFGDLICITSDYVHFLVCAASMLSLVGVSIERYIGVKFPLKSKKIITRKRVIMFMISIWVSAAMLTAIPLTVWPKNMSGITYICLVNLRTELIIFMVTCVYWIPISFIMFFYYLIYRIAISPILHFDDISYNLQGGASICNKVGNDTKMENDALTAERLKHIRFTKRIAWITGVIILFYGPVFVVYVAKAFELPHLTFHIRMTVTWIRYCCSAINPFMYALAVPGYRQEFRERLFGVRRGDLILKPSEITSNATTTDANEAKSYLRTQPKMERPQMGTHIEQYCTRCGNPIKKYFPNNGDRSAEIDVTSNIPLVHIVEREMQFKLRTSEHSDLMGNLSDVECKDKVNGIQNLRESVMGTVMDRRSRLLSNVFNSTQTNDRCKEADDDRTCIELLDEIVAQLELTFSSLRDSNCNGNLKHGNR